MDCASCAMKIENAMKRMPGVSDINVSYRQESLTLKFDEDRTSVAAIKDRVRALGFVPVGGSSWWRTRKALLVVVISLLFVVSSFRRFVVASLPR